MKVFTNIMKWYSNLQPKQFVLVGVFMLALASSIILGFAAKQGSMAAVVRDCDASSIDRLDLNGGCGAENATELIKDIRDNQPSDLQTIYAHVGLSSADYNKFAAEAMQGTLYRNGDVKVNGKLVATGAWTLGRTRFNDHRVPVTIGGKTYYKSQTQYSFADGVQSLPVMVWLGDDGAIKVAIMNACGNPLPDMVKITPSATCKALVQTQPDATNKPNTYRYTTEATFGGNAVLSRVVYHFSDGTPDVTKTSLTDAVEHTFTKGGEVTVTVYAKTLNGKEITAPVVGGCKKQVTYKAPMYVCVALVASALDDQMRKFRFTVKVNHDVTTTLKDADFTLDGTNKTTGVTTKDADGNIYKEYSFTDEKEHTIVAKVNFTTVEGVKSVDCQAKVTPKKLPKCEVPGFEHLPPNDERCGYCKPGIPKGDDRCKDTPPTPPEMPHTGAGSVVGLFAGTSLVGFVGHKLYLRRRNSR